MKLVVTSDFVDFGLVYMHNSFNWLITRLISLCSTWLGLHASLGTALCCIFSTPKHLVNSCQLNDGMTAGWKPGSYVKSASEIMLRLKPLTAQLFGGRQQESRQNFRIWENLISIQAVFFDQLRGKKIAIVRHNLRICGNPPLWRLDPSTPEKVFSLLWVRDNTLPMQPVI